eukprot:13374507-Heterocapsa_arctica.AAC.1
MSEQGRPSPGSGGGERIAGAAEGPQPYLEIFGGGGADVPVRSPAQLGAEGGGAVRSFSPVVPPAGDHAGQEALSI